nr:YaaC family protein [Streptomyces sp. HPF1205]
MEQAQQMFHAAEGAGPQTRALLIFYGLSQAGRAIAAAAVDLKDQASWNLNGHGIHASGFGKTFAEIELRTETSGNAGSFVRLSELLQSPIWPKSTVIRLGDVWDTLPLDMPYPLTKGDRTPPLHASPSVSEAAHPLLTAYVEGFPDHVVKAGTRIALDEFLTAYLGTVGYDSYVRSGMGSEPPDFERLGPDSSALFMNWSMGCADGLGALGSERMQRLHSMTRGYAGYRFFFPTIKGLVRDLHPLMAWWAVLYTLSMLTRYQPAQWAGHINIDAAAEAILIEKLLALAMEQLPALIVDTIDEVAAWPKDDAAQDDR